MTVAPIARRFPRPRVYAAAATLSVLLWLQLPGISVHAQHGDPGAMVERPMTTYERFLPLAEDGDAEAQHLLGYMYFYGEGVELDYDLAHGWFHLAAEEGEPKSMRNLGLFHAHAISRIPARFYDPGEANLWFSLAATASTDPGIAAAAKASYNRFLAADKVSLLDSAAPGKLGETVYTTHCAGCHGFDGRSSYGHVPSFARGDSLHKTDGQLLASIGRTLDLWPHRLDGISRQALQAALVYIRQQLPGGQTRVGLSSSLLPGARAPAKQTLVESALGAEIFPRFCGGCHGFNGIATYVNSPSFALGERLHKSDEELTASIRNGIGEMPSWEFMLQPKEIEALVSYVRGFQENLQQGIDGRLHADPESFFRFKPKSLDGPGNLRGQQQLD